VSNYLRCETTGSLTTITLNRPECGNLVSNEMGAELAGMIEVAGGSQLIVLRGAGENFCLGRDSAALRAAGHKDVTVRQIKGRTHMSVWTKMLDGESEETSSSILLFAKRLFPESEK